MYKILEVERVEFSSEFNSNYETNIIVYKYPKDFTKKSLTITFDAQKYKGEIKHGKKSSKI